MRIRGRRLYPSTLAERRIMMSLGGVPLYTPRGTSPYAIARRLSRVASGQHADTLFLRNTFGSQHRRGAAAAISAEATEQAETAGAQKPVAA